MNNARIERMIREVKAEPAEQFFFDFFSLVENLWAKAQAARPEVKLSLQ
ncbi:MAG: hypothetical protein IPP91_06220 [Betaproteobacteria bacterium]|nr:hypothetical protein [Betaproteobacteria bacterium]